MSVRKPFSFLFVRGVQKGEKKSRRRGKSRRRRDGEGGGGE